MAPTYAGCAEFQPDSFWETLVKLSGRLGRQLLEKVLVAYYVAVDPMTPAWAKLTLGSALVYVGFPADAIPDITPFVGFSDDATLLVAALASVATCVRVRHIREARRAMRAWGIRVENVDDVLDDDAPASEQ